MTVTVTDEDREAAAAWANDTTPLVQAFARHREAATLAGIAMGLEAAIGRPSEMALRNLNTQAGRAAILAAHTRAKADT